MTDLLYTPTQCCFSQDLYTDMPHCDLQMVGKLSLCVEILGEKYKSTALMLDPHFPLVLSLC